MYWDLRTLILWPPQLMVSVPGSSVVSVRNRSFPTCPSRMADRSRLIGYIPLVTRAGFENVGLAVSTRSRLGAQPRPL
jgi:hypothetical protein